jgi:hypothetical protein
MRRRASKRWHSASAVWWPSRIMLIAKLSCKRRRTPEHPPFGRGTVFHGRHAPPVPRSGTQMSVAQPKRCRSINLIAIALAQMPHAPGANRSTRRRSNCAVPTRRRANVCVQLLSALAPTRQHARVALLPSGHQWETRPRAAAQASCRPLEARVAACGPVWGWHSAPTLAISCDMRSQRSQLLKGPGREPLSHVADHAALVKCVPCIRSAHRRTVGDRLSDDGTTSFLLSSATAPARLDPVRHDTPTASTDKTAHGQLLINRYDLRRPNHILSRPVCRLPGHLLRSFSARFCCPILRLFVISLRLHHAPFLAS